MQKLAEGGLAADKLGAMVHDALTLPRPKVRYAISPEPLQLLMMRILPKRMLDRIIAKRLGLLPKT
jgi:hypothetical protein